MQRFFKIGILWILALLILVSIVKGLVFPIWVKRHNQRLLNKIQTLNKEQYSIFEQFVQDIETQTEWGVLITSTYRTTAEQELLKQKDTRNASAGHSKHNFGKAIDINLYKKSSLWGKWLIKSSSKKRWESTGILKIANKYNLDWGGNFKSYYDPVHFEM